MISLFGWRIFRVRGDSMLPLFANGDFVIGWAQPSRDDYTIGDILVVNHPRLGHILKAVRTQLSSGHILLGGTSSLSTASTDLGPIAPACVSAKVRWRISKDGASAVTLGNMVADPNGKAGQSHGKPSLPPLRLGHG